MPRPRKTAVFDFETDPFEYGKIPKAFMGVYLEEDSEPVIFWGDTAARDLFNYMEKRRVNAYAHNGGKFDLFMDVEKLKSCEPKVINGRIAQVKMGKAVVKDSYCILPVSLATFNKDEMDYTKMHAAVRDQHREEITRYCVNDCRYLLDAVLDFVGRYGKRLTLAGSAFDFWKTNFCPGKIQNFTERLDARIRPYYYGGRTEAINPGIYRGNFVYLDINSAYPYVMSQLDHPWGTATRRLSTLNEKFIHRSFFSVFARSWGALPYRDQSGRLTFPRDGVKRLYHVTGHEIQAGLDTETVEILDIKEQIYFPGYVNFADYVAHFYDMKNKAKKAGDKNGYIFAKLFLNSLYGRTALDVRKHRDYKIESSTDYTPVNEGYTGGEIIADGIRVWSRPTTKPGQFLNVACGASITGAVRAMLWRAICKAKNPLYCDTDSIICESADLPISEKLGDWEIEGDGITTAAIAGKKLYATWRGREAYKTGCKGARLTADQIMRVAKGEEIQYDFDAPSFSVLKAPSFVSRKIRATF